MSDQIRIIEIKRMFAEAANQIRQEHQYLSRLDSIGGDGDHGTAMLRAFDALEASIADDSTASIDAWLRDAGWSVLSVDGGASTAILGTFIAGMGDAELGPECDCRQMAEGLVAGMRALALQTKARPGDRTMMDALVPAVDAFEAAACAGKTITEAMEEAAGAAQRGAEATKQMIARYGRAKFLGEKTRGSLDAGATSIALLFSGFNKALTQTKEA